MEDWRREVRTFVISLRMQFWREMGLKSPGVLADSNFGRSTRKARLILVRSILRSKKLAKTSCTSAETVSQKVEKKLGPKPSGPGLAFLFMACRAVLMSLTEKGSTRVAGRALPVG
jgi:hypothetical protein